ncbi:hypothetical protein VTN77DRAFT_9889 [Rasamsonia byssochlamydoides]|uniref:uncharacterized protein n=1 Tax=Rasamsonia byssochlamydoides TaxID=89139 RepID=UPI003744533D
MDPKMASKDSPRISRGRTIKACISLPKTCMFRKQAQPCACRIRADNIRGQHNSYFFAIRTAAFYEMLEGV